MERYIIWTDWPLREPTPNTYALPELSVRTVQPSGWAALRLSVAGPTCLVVQVSPPSEERATVNGVGSALPRLLLRNDAQQT